MSQNNTNYPSFSGNSMPMNVSTDVDDDIGEETTRRVGVMPSFAPSFQPVSFTAPPSFSNAGPSFSTVQQKVTVASPPPMKKSGWALKDAPTLPEFHPLDRSAVFVPYTSASEVAGRVSDVLRERSIDAKFDDFKAKAKCRTADNVDFRVRLYRGRNKYAHGIIVEVQRRFGASVSFCKDSAAILEAAQGKVPPPPPAMGSSSLPLVSDAEDDYDGDCGSSSLDFVGKMLSHPGIDAHCLALQTLSSLSDPTKMGFKTARNVCEALLEPDNDVGSRVIGLVVDSQAAEEETFSLRISAFTVLANALTVTRGKVHGMIREKLRPALIKTLKNASSAPQLAALAAKCFEPLLKGDHDAAELFSVFESAQAVGQARHAALDRQATKCLQRIESRY